MKRKNPSDNKITNGDLTDSSQKDIPLEKIKLKTNKIHDDCHDKVDITSHDYLSKYCAQECDFCGLKFQNRLSAIEHNVQHIIIPLVCLDLHHCTVCMLFFPSSKFLKDHMLSEHPEKIENINLQRKSIEDNSNCITSNTKPDDISERKYVRVKKEFQYWPENDTNSSDILDYESLLRPGFYRCKYCDKTFVNRYHALTHNIVHAKVLPLHPKVCPFCEAYLEDMTTLIKHLDNVHSFKKSFSYSIQYCRECKLPYNNWMSHDMRYHNLFRCTKCQRRFQTEACFKRHRAAGKCISNETIILDSSDDSSCDENETAKDTGSSNFSSKIIFEEDLKKKSREKATKFKIKNKNRKPFKSFTNVDRLKNIHRRLNLMKLLNK